MVWRLTAVFLFLISFGMVPEAHATPLNQWKVSCGADKGAISKKGGVWTFRTSSNHCTGGIFNQRAEISTKHVKPNIKGAYLFQTTMTMTSASNQPFSFFQIHDGRHGCAPPLSADIRQDGRILLKSDIKTGPGESCIRGTLTNKRSKAVLRRDGRAYDLKVLVDFDGTGAFDVTFWLDGVPQVTGRYSPSNQPAAFKPERYYFKHGVYSQNRFDYVMTSSGLKVRKVKTQ